MKIQKPNPDTFDRLLGGTIVIICLSITIGVLATAVAALLQR